MSIGITLPIPPSVNELYYNVRGRGRVKSATYRAWIGQASWAIQARRPGKVEGPYSVAIYLPAFMRGDIDNRIKPVLDLLVKHGITPDDRRAVSAGAHRCETVPRGEVLIVVEAA